MKAGRRLLVLTLLMTVLIVLIFVLPDMFMQFKMLMGLATIVLLVLFLNGLWRWKKTTKQRDLSEIEAERTATTLAVPASCACEYHENADISKLEPDTQKCPIPSGQQETSSETGASGQEPLV